MTEHTHTYTHTHKSSSNLGNSQLLFFMRLTFKKEYYWDCLDGPVAKTLLPMQGGWVQSLVGELDPIYHN